MLGTPPCAGGFGTAERSGAVVQSAYDWVGEVMNAFFVADEGAVDGVDDQRRPADDERYNDEDQSDRDVLLLFIDVVLVDGRTVSQVMSVRTNLSQHSD